MGARPASLSGRVRVSEQFHASPHGWAAVAGAMDHGLSTVRPAFARRRASANAYRYAVRGAGSGTRRKQRRVLLTRDVRRRGRALATPAGPGESVAPIPIARRVFDGGRFSRIGLI